MRMYSYNRISSFRTTADNIRLWVAIVLAILIFPVSFGFIANHHENVQSRTYALSFSEVEEIEQRADAGDYKMNSLNHYLPLAYDGIMKVLECSNVAVKRSTIIQDYDDMFASEMDMRLDPSLKVYKYDLSNLLGEKGFLQKWADVEKNPDLKQLNLVLASAQKSSSSLSPVWDVNHEDVYHTEIYYTTETDAQGRSHTEMHTREVYDYTIHTYTYHPEKNPSALSVCNDLTKAEFPDDLLKFYSAKVTHAENEYAMDTSHRRKDMDARLKNNQLLMSSSNWLYSSSVPGDVRTAKGMLCGNIPPALRGWESMCKKATSHQYQNTNREGEEPGPEDYQVFASLQDDVQSLCHHVGKVFDVVSYTRSRLEQIGADAKELVKVKKDFAPGSASKLRKRIIQNALDAYRVGFENAPTPSYYRVWFVVMWSAIGVALASLSLFLLDFFRVIQFPRN